MRELTVGDKLDQYQLTELLARSGMASIFKAVDTETGATVALKVPHFHLESDIVFFERFLREETLGQRLDHPGVIKIFKPAKKTRMYIAMEYIEGTSLRAVMQTQRSLPREKALDIACQLCESLAYLHGQGIVHRDVKPENIMLLSNDRIKLLDFGIALDKVARRLTWSKLSTTMGTPDYMAPEQIGGRRGDARTDVYAAGTLLYEMLTGHLPYAGVNAHALLRAKTHDDPRPPSYFVSDIDPSLEAIILKAIERDPRERYATADEMLKDLRDPSAVPARDPETGQRRRRSNVVFPRRFGMLLLVAAILFGLTSLIRLSGRHTIEAVGQPVKQR
jgi:serine/threonine protein kinase